MTIVVVQKSLLRSDHSICPLQLSSVPKSATQIFTLSSTPKAGTLSQVYVKLGSYVSPLKLNNNSSAGVQSSKLDASKSFAQIVTWPLAGITTVLNPLIQTGDGCLQSSRRNKYSQKLKLPQSSSTLHRILW